MNSMSFDGIKKNILFNMTIIMLILSICCLIIGVTYGLFNNFQKGNTSNMISAGVISFTYDESESLSNGIRLVNAFPISDDVGMSLSGDNKYFDFSITCKSTLADVMYQIILEKDLESTLADNYVKVYLTRVDGYKEKAVDSTIDDNGLVKTYDEFDNYNDSDKVIYNGKFIKNDLTSVDNFRLRMWIKDGDYTNDSFVFDKNFSVKVKVEAKE